MVPALLSPGSVLAGRYAIHEPLGSGGMGTVYRGAQISLGGRPVAIKQLLFPGVDDATRESLRRCFEREGSLLATLDHPNLVRVIDYFEVERECFLVMEYIDGHTLDRVVREGPPDLGQVLDWMTTVCDVLDYLHTHDPPVLVRDLKPSNIMIDPAGRLRLIDFGIAREAQSGGRTDSAMRGAGTMGYSPIEQFGGGGTDARSDIYALGATMYALLTGTVPPGSTEIAAGDARLEPPSRLRPGLPAALDDVILKMMAIRKEERHASAADVRDALREISAAVMPPYVGETLVPASARARRPGTAAGAPDARLTRALPPETAAGPTDAGLPRAHPSEAPVGSRRASRARWLAAVFLLAALAAALGLASIRWSPPVPEVPSSPAAASGAVPAIAGRQAVLYVANTGGGSIASFDLAPGGFPSRGHARTWNLSAPYHLAVDGRRGILYASNSGKNSVLVAQGLRESSPQAWRTRSLGGFLEPGGIAVDHERDILYVSNIRGDSIVSIHGASKAEGRPAPTCSFGGVQGPYGLFVDTGTDRLFASSGARIVVYEGASRAAGKAVPSFALDGPQTGAWAPDGLFVQGDELYVANQGGSVVVYSVRDIRDAPAPAPSRTVEGGFRSPTGVLVDPILDLLYVVDREKNALFVFRDASTVNGRARPAAVIEGDAAGLESPTGLTMAR